MAQVKTPDTAFLLSHDPDQHARMAIGAVAVVDGLAPNFEMLKTLVSDKIQSIPRCTQLLRAQSFEWIDDPHFELTDHMHRVAVPHPGDDAALSRAIARALESPLNADRPPWECWVIEGLKGNRWALLMKTHPCLTDGNSAAHLLTRLCDDADSAAFVNHAAAQRVAPPPQQQGWMDALWRAPSIAAAVTNGLAEAVWPLARMPASDRRYSAVRVAIADVDDVCRKFKVTANDVAVAAITEGFRSVLLARGEQPRADSLRTLVPMPVSSDLLPYLPVDHDDPVQRLRSVHRQWKAGQVGQPSGGMVESAISRLPIMLRSNVVQLLSRLPRRGIVTLAASTAPGPRHRLRLMGQAMERLLPIPPTAAQCSSGVAVLSYGDELVFGITAGHDASFDVKQLAAGIELGMARLVALSHDSVLLFGTEHRRRRAARAVAGRAPRAHRSAPGQARH